MGLGTGLFNGAWRMSVLTMRLRPLWDLNPLARVSRFNCIITHGALIRQLGTLLNNLFQTNFTLMNEKVRNQTTIGKCFCLFQERHEN